MSLSPQPQATAPIKRQPRRINALRITFTFRTILRYPPAGVKHTRTAHTNDGITATIDTTGRGPCPCIGFSYISKWKAIEPYSPDGEKQLLATLG
jgi:hypothetical protein